MNEEEVETCRMCGRELDEIEKGMGYGLCKICYFLKFGGKDE